MKEKRLKNIHPGEVLLEEFLKPMNISAYRLAKELGIPRTRVYQIIKGKRSITLDTALRLSQYFGTSPQFWMGLQNDYDLENKYSAMKETLNKIKRVGSSQI